MKKYIYGAVGLIVGYIVGFGFFNFLENLRYGKVMSEVVYNDYGIAIVIVSLACGLVFMGIGNSQEKKKQQ